MASWAQFETQAPELAEVAARLWPGVVALHRGALVLAGVPCFAVSYIATVRRDGGPRLHPFCPVLAGGRLFAAIPPVVAERMGSAQGLALRDPRPSWPRG